jgi:hypothetical protein
MSTRYFRINRAAYTIAELATITIGLRKLLLPALIARLLILKLLGKTVPIGDPIAETRVIANLDEDEAAEVRRRHPFSQRAENALPRLGFTELRYVRNVDPRYPYASYCLCGIDSTGSVAVGSTVMTRGDAAADWIEYSSRLADGRVLRSSNHPLAGALRPPPSAITRRMPGASWRDLRQFHVDERERMRSHGTRFVEGLDLDQVIQSDRDSYRDLVAHWLATGLLVPEDEPGSLTHDG